jgi:hypothetical protein
MILKNGQARHNQPPRCGLVINGGLESQEKWREIMHAQ